MRGAETDDGKIAGNRQLVDRYNEAKGKKKKSSSLKEPVVTGPQRPGATGGESGGEREHGGHDEIKQVVMDHGPAHSTHIHHRGDGHEDGKYHVVSHHEDGHVHHADHSTLGAATEHAAHAHDDTEHLGDMPKDDYEVAREKEDMEEEGSGSTGTSRVGYMS